MICRMIILTELSAMKTWLYLRTGNIYLFIFIYLLWFTYIAPFLYKTATIKNYITF